MKERLLSKIIAIILIMILTLADVLMVGFNIITYAMDEIGDYTITNNKNVAFDVYFKGDNGEILQNKEESINNKEIRLFMRVAVNNEGNFNGKICLNEDSNFKLKEDILGEGINQINGNTIVLNQINASETVEVEVGIEPIKESRMNVNLLNRPSTLTIYGKHKDRTEEEKEIQAQREVRLILDNPYAENEGQELTSEILTNSVYEIEGENKRVVQILLKSGLYENQYPIKSTNVEISTLEGMQGINVITRGTTATNGKSETDFGQDNWQYVQTDDKVQIQVVNEQENGDINWLKEGRDEFVVTYLLDENASIENKEITATATITLYDMYETQKTASTTVAIQEEKDGIITTSTTMAENNIYKGKIYAKIERNYDITTNIYVSSDKVNQNIEINLKEATYQAGDVTFISNVQYLKTVIDKSQMQRILGEDGAIRIATVEGGIIAQINKDTQMDEKGKITIQYPEGIKQIIIQTTQVVNTGTFQLETTKGIKPEEYDREVIRQFQAINETTTDSNTKIILNETTTTAKLEVNNNHLSTLSKNENVEISVTLSTDDERYDLYKNPKMEVVLPNNIQNIEVKSIHLIHGNNFEEDYTELIEKNGQKVIQIGLKGEQTNYTADINQTTIVITADIEFGMITPSQIQNISLSYTNENGQQEGYHEATDIYLESKYGLMIYSQLNNFNESGEYQYTIDNDVPIGSLDRDTEGRMATMGVAILNNYDEDMREVSIIGRIPAKGVYDGNIDTQLINGIETSLEGVTILYSKSSTVTAQDDAWTESSENAKSFRIVLDYMPKGQVLQIKYNFAIPEGLSYGQSLYGRTEVDYTYLGNRMSQTSNIGAETERLTMAYTDRMNYTVTTNMNSGMDISISTTTTGTELKDGDSVYEGQTIKYIMQIKNNTGNDLHNVKVQAVQENGSIYDLKEKDAYNDGTGQYNLKSYFWEELDTNGKTFTIENLKNGENKELVYQIVVNEVKMEEAKTVGNITVEAENLETQTVKTITNPIKQAKLKMLVSQANAEELELYSLNATSYVLQVKNLSDETLRNVAIELETSQGLEFTEPYEVKAYLPNRDGKEADVINGVISNNDILTINLSKIEPGDNGMLNIVLRPYLSAFEGETQEVSMYTRCKLSESETYFSNLSNRMIYQTEDKVTIKQTANALQDTVLEDNQEFEIRIEAENKGAEITAKIEDIFENGLTATSGYWYTQEGKTTAIEVDTEDTSEENVDVELEDNEDYNKTERVKIQDNKLLANKKLKQGEKITIVIKVVVDTTKTEGNSVTNIASLSYNLIVINSNELTFRIKPYDENKTTALEKLKVEQTANPEDRSSIQNGQEILYTTTIANNIEEGYYINIADELPAGIVAKEVHFNRKNVTSRYLSNGNKIAIDNYLLEGNATVELQIKAVLEESQATSGELTNFVSVSTVRTEIKSNGITYYLANKGLTNGNSGTYTISGVAWLDADKSGSREPKEKLLSGIKVKAVDANTGDYVQKDGSDLLAETSSDGAYSLQLNTGNYIVVFEYDTVAYKMTEYQKAGVGEDINSDAISKTIGNSIVGVTDTIALNHANVNNVDIGLVQATVFDLELNKAIDRVTVQNKAGSSIYDYDNATMAKIEIDAKRLNGSQVVLEYTIGVTNTGEVEGYVKNLVDYMPNSLDFNSVLNKDWHQSGSNLYNTSLENTKIEPGETKSVTLVLTKTMTEDNTGLVSNTAEIADAYNMLGISDIDSIPGNAVNTEDDFGSADIIISVKTGALILYVSLMIVIGTIISVGIYFMRQKIVKGKIKL